MAEVIISDGKLAIGETQRLSTLTVKPSAAFNLTGTVAKAADDPTLVGTGTAFLSQVGLGDRVTVPGGAAETRTVVAIASDASLTVDSDFQETASAQTAECLPAVARFTNAAADVPIMISDEGLMTVGTLVPKLNDESPLLHLHSPTDDPFLLMFSNDTDDVTAGIGIWLETQDSQKQLGFRTVNEEPFDILTLGTFNGIGIGAGVRIAAITVDSNTTLTSGELLVYVDAGSGGVTITLPPVSAHDGRIYRVFKIAGAGDVTISPDGSELINGVNSSKSISTTWAGLALYCVEDLGGWIAVAQTPA